jgi:hypothetical protein
MATQRDDHRRPLPSAQCSMCGIVLPTGLMVPDGGQACADVRWYCQDVKSCSERWTANLPRHPHIAPTSASLAPPTIPALVREVPPAAAERGPGPGRVPADRRARPAEGAWSIDPS